MSKIVEARALMAQIERKRNVIRDIEDEIDALHRQALKLMVREPAVRRARGETVPITDDMRDEIERLSKNKRLTMHDIGRKVGLRNGGRVSEVLTGKR